MTFTPDRRSVLAAAAAALAPGAAFAQGGEAVVRTRAGAVKGVAEPGVWSFKGIPYGQDTGGAARFLPPKPAAAWTGVRDATAFGDRAPQLSQDGQIAREMMATRAPVRPGAEGMGENCLVLNVYGPPPGGRRDRPVLFWLHGGGYASGSGGGGYDGAELARDHDLVVVTINHRLNLFGFTDLSAYGPAYAQSADVGLMDAVLALRWVRDNIAAFGGDPGNVTIFGHSGGGGKVSTLLASPLAKGLFHKAIAQSGAVLRGLTREEARDNTADLLKQLKISGPEALARLQRAPAADLLGAMAAIGATGNPASTRLNFGPTVGRRLIPHHPASPEGIAVSARLPVMTGSTSEETRSFYIQAPNFDSMSLDDARRQYALACHTTPANAEKALTGLAALRPQMTPSQLFIEATTVTMFGRSSWMLSERRAGGPAPTFLYRVNWRRPGADGARLGAAHGIEVRLIFGRTPATEAPEIAAMRKVFRTAWASFARTGRPTGPGLPAWPAYDLKGRAMLVFDDASSIAVGPRPDLAAWERALPDWHP